jgi:hypothetical protein
MAERAAAAYAIVDRVRILHDLGVVMVEVRLGDIPVGHDRLPRLSLIP